MRGTTPPDSGKIERILAIEMSGAQGASSNVSVSFAALDRETLLLHSPERVVFPLFGPVCDALLVIERLEDLGYAGQMTVVSPVLPRPKLVEAELRAAGPGARLTLLVVGPDQA